MVISHDTTVCANQPVTLYAHVNNAPTTSINYSISAITFQPDVLIAGTSVNLNDDDQTSPIPLPFKFCFYGNTYNHFIIGSNGWVGFSSGQPNSWYGALVPNTSVNIQHNCIMLPLQDLNPHAGGTISYAILGVAPYRRLVVNYDNVPLFDNNPQNTCGVTFTGQVKLFETTNVIETHLTNKPICTAWNNGNATHALHDSIGNAAAVVPGRNFTAWSANHDAYAFTPNGNTTEIINWYSNGNLIGNSNSIVVTPSQTTVYKAFGYYGCGSTDQQNHSITVHVSDLHFNNPSIITTPISCNNKTDGALQANASGTSGTLTYLWNTSQTTSKISNLSAGNYSVTVQDGLGCQIQANASLTNPSVVSIQTQNVIFPTCNYSKDGLISIQANGGTPPYQYVWNNGCSVSTNSNLPNGNYSAIVNDAHQCNESVSFNILTPAYSVNVGPDRTIGINENTIIRTDINTAGLYTYQWSPNYQLSSTTSNTVTANPNHTTNYKVIVTNQNGCVASDSITIKVTFDNGLTLMNAFSPNNDGQNDDFSFRKFADIFHLKSLEIYNRWGEKVYSSHDIEQGWDGTYKGKPQEIGSYIYQALVIDYNGEEHLLKGNVSLIR